MTPFPDQPKPARAAAWSAALLASTILAALAVPGATASTPDWAKAAPVTVATGLAMPADIAIAPDGAIWYVELAGKVGRIDPATGQAQVMREVPDVVTGGERGLVGLALAKDFAQTGTYFLYYTKRTADPDGGLNHLVRIDGDKETVLFTVSGAKEHNGGRIVVDGDGNLFVTTGENQLRDPAQDLDSLLGKILHLTPDGQPVEGNVKGLVHSYGHRNPFGLALNPENGELWETENSGWRRDEINVIQRGGNYGYPECEGWGLNGVSKPCPTNKGYIMPVRTFYENNAPAPTGATFWRGEFYWASLDEGAIHHTWRDDAGEYRDAIVYDGEMPILDLAVGGDDSLYLAMADGAISRISLPDVDLGNSGGTTQPRGTDGRGPAPGTGANGDAQPVDGGDGNDGNSPVDPDDAGADSEGAPAPGALVALAALAAGFAARRRRA